jgi:hypothetical protein
LEAGLLKHRVKASFGNEKVAGTDSSLAAEDGTANYPWQSSLLMVLLKRQREIDGKLIMNFLLASQL